MIKSQQRFQFTLKGVRREANIGMALHTLVLMSDSFVILLILACQLLSKSSSHISLPLLCLYITQCKFYPLISFQDHHPLVQHVPLHTTGSSMYEINYVKCTYVHLSLFHSNVSNIQHTSECNSRIFQKYSRMLITQQSGTNCFRNLKNQKSDHSIYI